MDDSGSRLIFGLMAFAVAFSLIGNEIKVAESSKGTTSQLSDGVTEGGKIILGGFFATALLVLLSHAGKPGHTLGVGVATVAALSSTLVYGGPIWSGASGLFGSSPTVPLATATTPTGTSPTTSQKTGVAA